MVITVNWSSKPSNFLENYVVWSFTVMAQIDIQL